VLADLLADPAASGAAAAAPMLRHVGPDRFAEFVDALRDSGHGEIVAHAGRLRGAAWRPQSLRCTAFDGDRPVACGQFVVENGLAGIYDVVVARDLRGRGLGRWLTAQLLQSARASGATVAYLQVDADNAPARALYARLGFVDRYAYWYRARPGDVARSAAPTTS
jgi:ribosomal protein S18 acetylase RimI-like enzyme